MFSSNMGNEAIATVLSVLIAIAAVTFVILFGWLVVWKMFLIRFSFIRELFYGSSNGSSRKTKEGIMPTPLRRSSRIRDMKSRK